MNIMVRDTCSSDGVPFLNKIDNINTCYFFFTTSLQYARTSSIKEDNCKTCTPLPPVHETHDKETNTQT